ncbi:hypothetical protein RF11_11371 [Thelohanellus kitauei]|uniref:Uncharacterized protein n=1 Tax=Thelohanellus kitauei TaxID=669202 RepID=A0A0C2MBP7_THEKT|nr:hypothetical protein RF11_11371 [Thelohanellus kitauei]
MGVNHVFRVFVSYESSGFMTFKYPRTYQPFGLEKRLKLEIVRKPLSVECGLGNNYLQVISQEQYRIRNSVPKRSIAGDRSQNSLITSKGTLKKIDDRAFQNIQTQQANYSKQYNKHVHENNINIQDLVARKLITQ